MVRVCGDNLFLDAQVIKDIVEVAKQEDYDLLSNTKGRTFPFGMSVEVVRTEYYREMIVHFSEPLDYEHIMFYLYRNEGKGCHYYHYNEICPEAKGLHLALDEKKDLVRAEKMLKAMKHPHVTYGLKEIYELWRKIE